MRKLIKGIFKFLTAKRNELAIICTLMVLTYLIRDFLFTYHNKLVVEILLKPFDNASLPIIIILLYLIIFIIGTWRLYEITVQQTYKASLLTLLILIGVSGLYWNERIFEARYTFAPLVSLPGLPIEIAQLDLLFTLTTLASITLLKNSMRLSPYLTHNSFLIADEPLNDVNKDQYRRAKYYNGLISKIKEISFDNERGFSIGINSRWGFGKTSLLNIMKAGLEEIDKTVCFSYNPWLAFSKKGLTHDFFATIEEELSKFTETSSILKKYGEQISKLDYETNTLKGASSLFESDKSLESRFGEISLLIKSTNRRFFVIVDDLDRLDNSEVLDVLRLVRNTANFPRLHFIAAYDKEYLINALEINNIHKPEKYLEKIFDVEILLPNIENQVISEILLNLISKSLERLNLEQVDYDSYHEQIIALIFNPTNSNSSKLSIARASISQILASKRDIIKFVNSFVLVLSVNKEHVYLPDLFLLELLKFRNNSLYTKIAANDKFLDFTEREGLRVYRLRDGTDHTNDRDYDLIINSQREGLYNLIESELDSTAKSLIIGLFEPAISTDFGSRNALNIVDNYHSYFIYNVPSGTYSFQDIDNLILD